MILTAEHILYKILEKVRDDLIHLLCLQELERILMTLIRDVKNEVRETVAKVGCSAFDMPITSLTLTSILEAIEERVDLESAKLEDLLEVEMITPHNWSIRLSLYILVDELPNKEVAEDVKRKLIALAKIYRDELNKSHEYRVLRNLLALVVDEAMMLSSKIKSKIINELRK